MKNNANQKEEQDRQIKKQTISNKQRHNLKVNNNKIKR